MSDLPPMPKVRHMLMVITPKNGRVAVTEQRESVRLSIVTDGGSERDVDLTLPEARKVAFHINALCTRIARRPAGHP